MPFPLLGFRGSLRVKLRAFRSRRQEAGDDLESKIVLVDVAVSASLDDPDLIV